MLLDFIVEVTRLIPDLSRLLPVAKGRNTDIRDGNKRHRRKDRHLTIVKSLVELMLYVLFRVVHT